MKQYLSHFSAAKYWAVPYIEVILGSEIAKTEAVHLTVSQSRGERRMKQGENQIIHSCEITLPGGAVVPVNGKLIASPELVFLQLAGKLDIRRLILLGLQLCSHPPGKASQAITTKRKLAAFLAKTPGHYGHVNALRAVKYIENGSASVMESLVYMILTLPNALGGYGLNGGVFNQEIRLNDEARKRLGQKCCFADLYYKSAKLAVEYESFAFHSRPAEQGKDAIRSAILDRHGIEVMHLSTIQLYDEAACKDFAFSLAVRLGKRIQIRAKKFDEMNALLRALLPVGNPGIDHSIS